MSATTLIDAIDWSSVSADLDAEGYAVTPPLLSKSDCAELATIYDGPAARFRSTVDMSRYHFGRGRYRYLSYPLPPIVQALRERFYPPLSVIANDWSDRLGQSVRWPESLEQFLDRCHSAGQIKPTPLLLRYAEGDFNCLHQDLYGDIYFPLQVVILLSEPGTDFDGGELILVEQRPRMQSRPVVVPIRAGSAAIVPVRERPRAGKSRVHRVQLRHGVSRIHRGSRTTLGLIFHDAK